MCDRVFLDRSNTNFSCCVQALICVELHTLCRGHGKKFRYGKASAVAGSIYWRMRGAVAAVKDQGNCGSY